MKEKKYCSIKKISKDKKFCTIMTLEGHGRLK